MNVATYSTILGLLFAVTGVFSELPADVQKCNYEDSACLKSTIAHVIQKYFSSGIRSTNLVPFDPLRVKAIGLAKNPTSPVSIDLNFRDVDFLGLSQAKIDKVTGFDKGLTKPVEVTINVPRFILKGPYTVNGQILFLPITGKGDAEMVFEQAQIKIKLKMKFVNKGGKNIAQVDTGHLLLLPKNAKINLTGLFNGNKELADNMLRVINENWQDILHELQPDISKALGLVVQGILNNVFSKDSYESFFQ